jgi:hypothetical protein
VSTWYFASSSSFSLSRCRIALNCASRLSACSVLVMFSNEVLINACGTRFKTHWRSPLLLPLRAAEALVSFHTAPQQDVAAAVQQQKQHAAA